MVAASAMGRADDDLLNLAINGTRVFGERSHAPGPALTVGSIDPGIFVESANRINAMASNDGGPATFWGPLAVSFVPEFRVEGAIRAALVQGARLTILHNSNAPYYGDLGP